VLAAAPPVDVLDDDVDVLLELELDVLELVLELETLLDEALEDVLAELALDEVTELLALDDALDEVPPVGVFVLPPLSLPPPPQAASAVQIMLNTRADLSPEFTAFIASSSKLQRCFL
jgi:hypothetical protein